MIKRYFFIPNPIYPDRCQIDIKILKMILIMYGNRNQRIFTVISKENLIDFLYIILCFKYTDDEEFIEGLNYVLSKLTFRGDVPDYVRQLKINGFDKLTFRSIMDNLYSIYNGILNHQESSSLKMQKPKKEKRRGSQ
jgi:hypothetical protein